MRKLATVTAVAALFSAMITIPAADAKPKAEPSAEEVVILKCVESELFGLSDVTTVSGLLPTVLTFQGTSTQPTDCAIGDLCAPCLKALMIENKCKSPKGPVVVGSSALADGTSQDAVNIFGAVTWRFTSVETYLLQCKE